MAGAFRKGEQVEVWSNSAGTWLPGVIEEAAAVACMIDGYSIPAGAVKVLFAGKTKWVLPATIAKEVRRPAAAVAAAGGYPAAAGGYPKAPAGAGGGGPTSPSSASRQLCKMGCGRPVAEGLTRGMKAYDTCCKACARCEGRGKHDDNCGQTAGSCGALAAAADYDGPPPRAWLQELCRDAAKLQKHCGALLAGRSGPLPVGQAWDIIGNKLFEPINEKLSLTEPIRQKLLRSIVKGGMFHRQPPLPKELDAKDFTELCRAVAIDRFERWFPEKLLCHTPSFVRKNRLRLEDVYVIGKKLGEGSFGVVYEVTHKVSGERRVCKKILKRRGKEGMKVEEILAEIESMAKLDHPNIIKVYEYFEDGDSITQIMEPCNGGELQDKIDAVFRHKREARYTEAFICDVMKQTLRALSFIHGQRYLHKDLKPQNIMLSEKAAAGASEASIKVIDFGLAELFAGDKEHSDQFGGTLLYMAPEVFRLEIVQKSDVWSIGVILYNLITGDYPFIAQWPLPPGRDMDWWQSETSRIIQDRGVTFKSHAHLRDGSVSTQCMDLLRQMLQKDLDMRPDAPSCLEHEWFRRFDRQPPPLSVGVVQCLDGFSAQPELKKAIFLLIAHQATVPAIQELRAIFTHFDVGNRGALSLTTFRDVLIKSHLRPLLVERVLHTIDRDDSGVVQWTEFLAAALCVSVSKQQKLVDAAFEWFDHNRDGKISSADFVHVFATESGEGVWKDRIDAECALIAPLKAKGPFTKEDLFNYVGSDIFFTSGDALVAVP